MIDVLVSILVLVVLFLACGGWWVIWGYFYTRERR